MRTAQTRHSSSCLRLEAAMNRFLQLGAFFLLPAIAAAQGPGWVCTTTTVSPKTIRAQGAAEPVSDVLVTCSGGFPSSGGGSLSTNFKLTFSAPVASRLVSGNTTEALVLINV